MTAELDKLRSQFAALRSESPRAQVSVRDIATPSRAEGRRSTGSPVVTAKFSENQLVTVPSRLESRRDTGSSTLSKSPDTVPRSPRELGVWSLKASIEKRKDELLPTYLAASETFKV